MLYEIAVDAPLATALTYGQPVGREEPVPAGCCVRVPLGNRSAVGYVLGFAAFQGEETPGFTVKPIAEVLDETPYFPASLISFYRWVARYYHHPIGEVLRTALPLAPATRRGRRLKVKTRTLLQPGPLLLERLTVLRALSVADRLEMIEKTCARQLKKSDQKLLILLLEWFVDGPCASVPRSKVLAQSSGAGPRLQRLIDLGLIRSFDERVFRDPFFDEAAGETEPPIRLTDEQQQVLASVLPAVDAARFAPFLLMGVTGCGKTEVYLRSVEHALAIGKTALVLVPEIALASQLETHFRARFGSRLAVLHSGLSGGERFDQWEAVLSGAARVVLGARSAVFAPAESLGVVIVDEEHEPAYKQEDGLRYNGRDLAVVRAQMAACPVVLGSATPSLVSYHHCRQHKYTLLTMRKRVTEQPLPKVEIIDLTTASRSRPDLFFADPLILALRETLEQGKQSLLFVNRRGFSSFMLCRDCGTVLQCAHCQVSLTLHRSRGQLLCHYCGYSQHPSALCPSCGSGRMAGLGIGSERIEDEVHQLFPEARVARLDSDTTSNRRHFLATLKAVRSRQVDILIGTQMIAKGLHFPHITLVGVVWADSGLGMPDYKAAERTFSLLAQVTGRAGRGNDPGRVLIQTYQPHHFSIELARRHDYERFYEREVTVRRPLRYPPFSRLAIIRLSGRKEEPLTLAAERVADYLRGHCQAGRTEILGPSPSPLVKIKDRFRWQLLLKSPYPGDIGLLCEAVLAEKGRLWPRTVTLSIDVDPENML